MSDWNGPGGEHTVPEDDIGAELRRLFDVEQENLPPFFLETLQLSQGIDDEIDGYQGLEEKALRRFFAQIGRDYDAWHRVWQRRRRRRFATRVGLGVLLVASLVLLWGAISVLWPQTLEALRQPLIRWSSGGQPTPIPPEQIIYYDDVAGLQPYFTVPLPQQPPAGFWPALIALDPGSLAGPRGSISYWREPVVGEPDSQGDTVALLVWSLSDEPFPLSPRAVIEPIELAGQQALWIRNGPTDRSVVWEQGPYRWALYSSSLSRKELLAIAEDFYRQISGH